MKTRLTVACLSSAVVLMLGACANKSASADKHEDPAYCKSFKGEPTSVNRMCAVMTEDPVDPAVEPATWKGQKVGFCCEGCRPRWAKMTDAQKDASLAQAMKASAKTQ